jgi:hypothetical protein
MVGSRNGGRERSTLERLNTHTSMLLYQIWKVKCILVSTFDLLRDVGARHIVRNAWAHFFPICLLRSVYRVVVSAVSKAIERVDKGATSRHHIVNEVRRLTQVFQSMLTGQ